VIIGNFDVKKNCDHGIGNASVKASFLDINIKKYNKIFKLISEKKKDLCKIPPLIKNDKKEKKPKQKKTLTKTLTNKQKSTSNNKTTSISKIMILMILNFSLALPNPLYIDTCIRMNHFNLSF
jgi:hypothetical protein